MVLETFRTFALPVATVRKKLQPASVPVATGKRRRMPAFTAILLIFCDSYLSLFLHICYTVSATLPDFLSAILSFQNGQAPCHQPSSDQSGSRQLAGVQLPIQPVRCLYDLPEPICNRNITDTLPGRQQIDCVSVYQMPGAVQDDPRFKGTMNLVIQVLTLHLLRSWWVLREAQENLYTVCPHYIRISFL